MNRDEFAQRNKKLINLFKEGKSRRQLAKKFKVSYGQTCNLIRIGTKERSYEKAKIRRKEIAKMYAEGKSVHEVMKHFHITTATVYAAIREFEDIFGRRVHIYKRGNTANAIKVLAEMFKRSSVKDISEKFNITTQRVYQIYDAAKKSKIPGLKIRINSRKKE